MNRWAQRLMSVAWPAFLAACAMELLVFGMVDPLDMQWFGGSPPPLSRQGVYTVAFFSFCAVAMVACSLTALLVQPAKDPFVEPGSGR